jgi:hypothetical protein
MYEVVVVEVYLSFCLRRGLYVPARRKFRIVGIFTTKYFHTRKNSGKLWTDCTEEDVLTIFTILIKLTCKSK